MKQRLLLVVAILLPILVLAGQTWNHYQHRQSGAEVILPIQGFDPRDLLSGHYLIYRVDYGLDETNNCPTSDINAIACLKPEPRVYPVDELPVSCQQFIRGNCNNQSEFVTGLERFYIPEQYAATLEDKIRDNQGELVLSIDQAGNPAIRDLLIEGKPWKEWLEAE